MKCLKKDECLVEGVKITPKNRTTRYAKCGSTHQKGAPVEVSLSRGKLCSSWRTRLLNKSSKHFL